MNRIFATATFLAVLAPASFAQPARSTQPSRAVRGADDASTVGRTATGTAPKAAPRLNGGTQSPASYANSEVYRDFTVPPGQFVDLDSRIDFSASDTVRVTIRSRSTDLAKIVISAYWSVPEADFWNVADVVMGDTLAYSNVGGATFNTYGNQFRLRLTNTGTTAIALSQVLVFSRVQ